jgi:hypothetical protein
VDSVVTPPGERMERRGDQCRQKRTRFLAAQIVGRPDRKPMNLKPGRYFLEFRLSVPIKPCNESDVAALSNQMPREIEYEIVPTAEPAQARRVERIVDKSDQQYPQR